MASVLGCTSGDDDLLDCSAASEYADVEIGVLTCSLAEAGDAPASGAPSQERTRDALCAFKAKTGEEETYAGSVQGVSIPADR